MAVDHGDNAARLRGQHVFGAVSWIDQGHGNRRTCKNISAITDRNGHVARLVRLCDLYHSPTFGNIALAWYPDNW